MPVNVLGHDDIGQRFLRLYQMETLPHAWLLYGMRGVGKSLLAQKLAAIYLCEASDASQRPCGLCHSCRMIAGETHPDVQKIGLIWDEKKKRFRRDIHVEQIRETLAFLSLTGMQSQRRVVILDDADAMNGAAANALLKGLEEPPSGALILVVCHDLTSIPATIRSRCMLEHCSPLQDAEMAQVLQTIGFSQEVLSLSRELADGCPGRVAILQDEAVAKACCEWQQMTKELAKADLGKIEQWLQKHVNSVPHALIVEILMQPIAHCLEQERESFSSSEALFDVSQSILCWPSDIRRHALRPVPSLLSRVLDARSALKATG